MYALAQAPTLTPAGQQAVDAAVAVLPSCYTTALDACMNPDAYVDAPVVIDDPLPRGQCATINAAYDESDASWDAIDRIVVELPEQACGCPTALAGMPGMFLAGGVGLALGLLLARRRR